MKLVLSNNLPYKNTKTTLNVPVMDSTNSGPVQYGLTGDLLVGLSQENNITQVAREVIDNHTSVFVFLLHLVSRSKVLFP